MAMGRWNALLTIDLREILVPIRDCFSCTPGSVQSEIVEKLRTHGYSQAPLVLRRTKEPLGLVSMEVLEDRRRSGVPLTGRDVSEPPTRIRRRPRLEAVYKLFDGKKAIICIPSESGAGHRGASGLLTFSDLNRHPVRVALFAGLSALEVDLSFVIRKRYPDAEKWLSLLPHEARVRLRRYWEKAKKRDIDIGPLAAANLSDIFTIIGTDEKLARDLGSVSGAAFLDETKSIVELRNRVMHPVNQLLLNQKELAADRQTLNRILVLGRRIEVLRAGA
jgi:hypothetical protein